MPGKAVTPADPGRRECVSPLSQESGHTCPGAKSGIPQSETPLLAEDSAVGLAVEELAGTTLAEATDAYVAHRRGERSNEQFTSGTLLGRARRRYGASVNADRRLRREYDNPTVAMLTLSGSPVSGDEWITPVEYAEAVGDALSNVLARLRQLLSGYSWEYVAVRGYSDIHGSHWHIVIWIDGNPSTDTFTPAVESFINNCEYSTPKENPLDEAVKVNTAPSSDLKPIDKMDRERGKVSEIARYVATQIPHVSGVEAMTEAEAMQGAIEWATPSRGFRSSSGVKVTDSEPCIPVATQKREADTTPEGPASPPAPKQVATTPARTVMPAKGGLLPPTPTPQGTTTHLPRYSRGKGPPPLRDVSI